jgi:hypothetical protein
LEGEFFIYEIVDSEPKKKSKNKGGRLKRQNVTNPKGKRNCQGKQCDRGE